MRENYTAETQRTLRGEKQKKGKTENQKTGSGKGSYRRDARRENYTAETQRTLRGEKQKKG